MESPSSSQHPAAAASNAFPMAIAARAAAGPPQAAPHQASFWEKVHRSIQGQYRLAALLGLAAAAIGGAIGWKSQAPAYRSEGVVRIAAVLPPVMQETDQNQPMAMFDTFLQSQQLMISSPTLLDAAMQGPAWKMCGEQRSLQDFLQNVKVELKPRSDCLRISFTDRSPAAAAAAVDAVISAYEKEYNAQQDRLQRQRIQVLSDRGAALEHQLGEVEAQVRALVEAMGSSDWEPLYYSAVQQLVKQEAALAEVREALAQKRGKSGGREERSAAPPVLSAEQIAMVDPAMARYLGDRERLAEELERLRIRFGEAHPTVIDARRALDKGADKLDRYLELYSRSRLLEPSEPAGSEDEAEEKSIEALAAKEAKLGESYAQAKQDISLLGQMRLQLEQLQADRERHREALARVRDRIRVLQDEGAVGGRFSVLSRGGIPQAPLQDRRLRAGAAGALAGALLPFGVLFVLGQVSFRYRCAAQAAKDVARHTSVFAVLPALRSDLTDRGRAAVAAQCVHQARVRLEADRPEKSSRVYLVTSASAGEGKTSVALALGLSFAAAGLRTLVMDCDLVGRSLSRRFGADHWTGLYDALRDGNLAEHVRGTRLELFALTAGRPEGSAAGAVSSASLRKLLADARAQFEIVIVDSGPIPTSIEAAMIVPEVEGVVVVTAPGQRDVTVGAALALLRSTGAKLAGVVFNRARPGDFDRSVQAHAVSAAVPDPEDEPLKASGCGPLVDAVLTSLPSSRVHVFGLRQPDQVLAPTTSKVRGQAA